MFELFKDQGGKWRWRLRARNNEILATSEAYEGSADDARQGIEDLVDTVLDLADEQSSDDPHVPDAKAVADAAKVVG